MRKKCTAFAILVFMMLSLFSQAALAAAEVKLQVYFAPQIMNDQTGEIAVNINLRNFKVAVPSYMGAVCGLSFKFNYDTEKFDIKKNDDGSVYLSADEDGLIKNVSDAEVKEDNGSVSFSFLDSTLKDNLIEGDGTILSFVLISKNIKQLWNSFDTYPIRFVPGSVGAAAYRLSDYTVSRIYNIEAIDGKVGGYNKQPSFIMPGIDKKISLSIGKSEIQVNGETLQTDAAPFKQGEELMIPVRYFAESAGMTVDWKGEVMTASAYGDYRTLVIALDSEENATVYFNAAKLSQEVSPIEKDGRIYIPLSLINVVYQNAQITATDAAAEIYLP